jgi:hypothetical protein
MKEHAVISEAHRSAMKEHAVLPTALPSKMDYAKVGLLVR